ncbi:hypothetical protein CALVIDRAFT_475201 [Calocera viscosa TUFC12733]|uniref:CxC1-like cysteine cluster associated with KDZ transposases domain-containing protein n=1 Tax=Calocera viscosa (strain TUFC12733) TaxID=1330018 RepID=A0A167RX30_CALVF|nr:hypothetical protein CALVIDRAFT_475201 [Calocera viscosa TUFC12733]
MEHPRVKLRFEPARRRPGRTRTSLDLGQPLAASTPRSPPSALQTVVRPRTKRRRKGTPERPVPSLRPGSQWKGATTHAKPEILCPTIPSPIEVTEEDWFEAFGDPDDASQPRERSGRYDQSKQATYDRWTSLMPRLVDAMKAWHIAGMESQMTGNPWVGTGCTPSCEGSRVSRVVCVGFTVGYWPSSPTRPPRAFAIDLLIHYLNLYDSCTTPNDAFCQALLRSHADHGCYYLGSQGQRPISDPWRRSFSSAAMWFDLCRVQWKRQIRRLIDVQDQSRSIWPVSNTASIPGEGSTHREDHASARMLHRCPACFGLDQWGRPTDSGPDILVALDGNRQLKRLRRGGSSPSGFEPDLFLPKVKVLEARQAMEQAKARAKAATTAGGSEQRAKLPRESLDRCRRAFKVADENAHLVDDQLFDITGVVILVCRHDVPLFVCDITTPGERQEYGMALIWALLAELPSQATIRVLYDISCQVDHSCDLFGYLGGDRSRIMFACSVLHAYGHEWACQVVYNPRRRSGFGLTDGEGSERVWSRTRRLIPILRRANDSRRIFALERKLQRCGATMVETLGGWFKKKHRLISKHRSGALEDIRASGLSESQLRDLLVEQKLDSARSLPQTSQDVQRKIDLFKKLQTELERVGSAIQETVQSLSEEFGWPRSTAAFRSLSEKHHDLMQNGQHLLGDLRLDHTFPQLSGVSAQFLHYLLLAREEKINVRARVVEHLWELSRLRRARGGGHDPVGTKVRDAILKGWGPRWRTTKAAVDRYNGYVGHLKLHFNPIWNIPLPARLEVTDLQNPTEDHQLWQDVWWPTSAQPPIWVTNEQVRRGVTAVLLLDRCKEEEQRLILEGNNLEKWWINESVAMIKARERVEGQRSMSMAKTVLTLKLRPSGRS